ncbi:organic solute transporter Ostalpha-domain-containing protein [Abortiporus biennis]|nr:organic solute transporter Ostalpha-domain-containing protein [Abortiporus biennis]
MLMVPLYAISSLISLFSLRAAFFIDAVRDIYEAFVIYCFFDLLVAYLGGERSLLILLHGRPPKYPVFPGNILWREVDVSDPYTFLFLKRGVLQYVQVKPILALATILLKATGKFNEGDLRIDSGYLYVSVVYNLSICMALYCLAMFWMCVNDDLRPFRPMPKFLCVKGILFFSFWQSIFISILVTAGAITKLGPYTDNEHISLGLTDCLICLEMPLFAIAHQYAFSTVDFVDPHAMYVARMPVFYAFRDAFGLKDVVEDTKATLHGERMDYREFEPSEGHMHQGAGRDRRIRAGLRYSQGGKRKYWLPQPTTTTQPPGVTERRVNRAIQGLTGRPDQSEEVYAPLLPDQAEDVVHLAPDLRSPQEEDDVLFATRENVDDGFDLPFGDLDSDDEEIFDHSRKYIFGDYNYPCVDVSNEFARTQVWDEEERILRDERGAYFSPILGPTGGRIFGQVRAAGYGAIGQFHRGGGRSRNDSDASTSKGKVRDDMREAVIDKEQDRIPRLSEGDVHLRWTKTKNLQPSSGRPSPRIRTLSSQGRHSSSSGSGSSTPTPRDRHPPPSPKKENERILPPDAVDLVVEDSVAAEAKVSRERRKGEPAVHAAPGLRKVYRRGYVVDDEEGNRSEGEVEVETPVIQRSVDNFAAGDDVDTVLEAEAEAVGEAATIARAETPPAHARITVDQYSIGSEDNPWA